MMKTLIIADNQEITEAGLRYLFSSKEEINDIFSMSNKQELVKLLLDRSDAVVFLDYTLFDFSSIDYVALIQERFPASAWILFSDNLNDMLLRRIVQCNYNISVVLKTCSSAEIEMAFSSSIHGGRFICNTISNHLLGTKMSSTVKTDVNLTATEVQILREISMGRSAKEIAAQRNLSVHTVITHKKNIFRKLDVNNIQEATRYAMKSGIIDIAEYCI
ncbi:MAG: response regulator transcription factor [Rikenellaceae bacterium]|nr:response regulator transcription factor [Rikenellaceae bacterium]